MTPSSDDCPLCDRKIPHAHEPLQQRENTRPLDRDKLDALVEQSRQR